MTEAVAYVWCVVDGLAVRALAVVGIERSQHFLCRRQRAERMQLCVRPFFHLVQQVETPVTFIIIIRESVFNLNVVVVLLVEGEGQFGNKAEVVCAVDVGTVTVPEVGCRLSLWVIQISFVSDPVSCDKKSIKGTWDLIPPQPLTSSGKHWASHLDTLKPSTSFYIK